MGKVHYIRIQEVYYDRVISGNKTFEIRLNDRDYQVGDKLVMECIYPEDTLHLPDINPKVGADIGYITPFMQKDNWVVMSLLNVKRVD